MPGRGDKPGPESHRGSHSCTRDSLFITVLRWRALEDCSSGRRSAMLGAGNKRAPWGPPLPCADKAAGEMPKSTARKSQELGRRSQVSEMNQRRLCHRSERKRASRQQWRGLSRVVVRMTDRTADPGGEGLLAHLS